jgi:hypothetical protein
MSEINDFKDLMIKLFPIKLNPIAVSKVLKNMSLLVLIK